MLMFVDGKLIERPGKARNRWLYDCRRAVCGGCFIFTAIKGNRSKK